MKMWIVIRLDSIDSFQVHGLMEVWLLLMFVVRKVATCILHRLQTILDGKQIKNVSYRMICCMNSQRENCLKNYLKKDLKQSRRPNSFDRILFCPYNLRQPWVLGPSIGEENAVVMGLTENVSIKGIQLDEVLYHKTKLA